VFVSSLPFNISGEWDGLECLGVTLEIDVLEIGEGEKLFEDGEGEICREVLGFFEREELLIESEVEERGSEEIRGF
jgi:hypothetical protein